MRLLYVIDSLVPCGAEQSLVAMAPGMIAGGVRLDVAYLHDRRGVQAELEAAGATLFSLAGKGGRTAWLLRLHRLCAQRQPHLIHTTLFESNVVGRLVAAARSVPVVSSLVNVPYGPDQMAGQDLEVWKVRLAQGMDAGTARLVVRFHAITGYVADTMALRLRLPRERIDVIPRGRDPERLGIRTPSRRAAARASLGLTDKVPFVLAAARQERQKGLDILLEAFALVLQTIPTARLMIAGREGNQTALLQATADRLRLRETVTFLGVRSDVPELLCAADAFVLPSRWEGLGSVLLEAMALKAPLIASDLPPVREVLGDRRHARFVDPERPQALAGAIVGVLTEPGDTARRADHARARFLERFTVDKVTEEMLTFYDRALEGGKDPHQWVPIGSRTTTVQRDRPIR